MKNKTQKYNDSKLEEKLNIHGRFVNDVYSNYIPLMEATYLDINKERTKYRDYLSNLPSKQIEKERTNLDVQKKYYLEKLAENSAEHSEYNSFRNKSLKIPLGVIGTSIGASLMFETSPIIQYISCGATLLSLIHMYVQRSDYKTHAAKEHLKLSCARKNYCENRIKLLESNIQFLSEEAIK